LRRWHTTSSEGERAPTPSLVLAHSQHHTAIALNEQRAIATINARLKSLNNKTFCSVFVVPRLNFIKSLGEHFNFNYICAYEKKTTIDHSAKFYDFCALRIQSSIIFCIKLDFINEHIFMRLNTECEHLQKRIFDNLVYISSQNKKGRNLKIMRVPSNQCSASIFVNALV